jgi:lipopolysaccharide/colanic/teichoic acid biosynthesis glycosyltransferase
MLCKWEDLPVELQNQSVKPYYDRLDTHRKQLLLKRIFDVCVSFFGIIVFSPIFLITAIAIKLDTPGPVFYRQERITQYGRVFKIFKFRSMVSNAETGVNLTVKHDNRITKTGKFIRKFKIDELCQLIDVLLGNMTLVGTRPEVKEYVDEYTPEMMATLLLPAGITSKASIIYKNESELLQKAEDPKAVYLNEILPQKMVFNLEGIAKFGVTNELKLLFMTIFAILGKDYSDEEASEEVIMNE